MHQIDAGTTWDPYPPVGGFDDGAHRRDANRALGWSAVGLAATGAVELGIATLSGSVGLLGDAIHNLSDVSTSLVAFAGFRVSKRPASPSHPYGYERAEDLAGLGVAAVIWMSAAFAAYASVTKLTSHRPTSHLALGMVAALVAIGGNQVVALFKRRIGTRIQSTTLLADAKHSWLDAIASAGALLGLVGVASGLWWADGVAGLLVTGFIVHVGWEVTSEVVGHVMDGIDPGLLEVAEREALTVPGVRHVHVRGRWLGRTLLVEVEGFVLPDTSLAEAEELGRTVRAQLLRTVPGCRAVSWSPHALTP